MGETGRRFDHVPIVIPSSQINLDRLARSLGMSPRQINRIFRQAGLSSPIRELRRRRLLVALEEILGSNESIEKIAEQMGFYDRATFSRSVKRAFGFYPGHLRRTAPLKQQ